MHDAFIELDDGKIYRKALYLMGKSMVSCRFSQENQSIDAWDLRFGPADVHHRPSVHGLAAAQAMLPAAAHRLRDSSTAAMAMAMAWW